MYVLSDELRERLKTPLGPIVQRREAFAGTFIAVGDQCLSDALEDNKEPMIGIYDNLIKREPSSEHVRAVINAWDAEKVILDNPPGTLTDQGMAFLRNALKSKESTKIEVRGEEDLLVIPCLVYAKTGVNIYYGQPGEGIVLAQADEKNREKARKILEEMRQ